jgi:superfamily II DNA or RNA helicase
MDTLELIVKPTQSGKTFIMLQEISKMLENNDDNIHIIFCDNQLLQTEQTSDRINKYDDLETYISEEGDISLILSSKSKITKYSELTHHICGNLKTIITCSNKKRVEDIDKLIMKSNNFY